MKRSLLLVVGLFCFVPSTFAQSADEKKATIAYLQKLQTKDGGFLTDVDTKAPTLGATTAAVRALKYFGGKVPDAKRAADFVHSCYDEASGGFANEPGGTPTVATTAVGAMAVVALGMPVAQYREEVLKYLGKNAKSVAEIRIAAAGVEALNKKPPEAAAWLDKITKMRNEDGTFGISYGVARDTGGSIVILLRLGAKVEKPDVILKALNAGQLKDGGFGEKETESDLETIYRVMRAYHMLKAKPEGADRVRKFVAACRNADGGYGLQPRQPSTAGPTYYAASILHWLDEK
jgi:hypothetical protein